MIVLLGIACTGLETFAPQVSNEAESPDETVVRATLPNPEGSTPYVVEPEVGTEELLSMSEVELGIEELIEVVLLLDPMVGVDTYEDLRVQHSDTTCPSYVVDDGGVDYNGYQYWNTSCTNSTGAQFSGNARSYTYRDYYYDGYTYSDWGYLYGFGSIEDRFGDRFEVAGTFKHHTYVADGSTTYYGAGTLSGDLVWDADEAQGTWLAAEYSLDTKIQYATKVPGTDNAAHYIKMSGSISGMNGTVNTAWMDDLYMIEEDWASSCDLEPYGTIAVRDENGEWYDVQFDGPSYYDASVFTPECDGCGEVTWQGEPLGTVCPDFAPLLDWELRPWD